jgi:ATP-dependent Clp protease adaptor protein ClpS
MAATRAMPLAAPDIEIDQDARIAPRWHVVLLNDDDHTYDYVIEMLMRLFGHPPERAFQLAREVDSTGRVIVDTTSRERAELKQEQIHAYGRDERLARSAGSMSAEIEPAD